MWFMRSFKEYLTQKKFAAATITHYEQNTEEFLTWLQHRKQPPEAVSYNDLLDYIKEHRERGKRYAQRQLVAIRHYYNYLIKTGKIKSNPAQGLFIRGVTRRLPHDLAEYTELIKFYEGYTVKDIRTQRNKVILGLLIYQALTVEELEKLEEQHIHLREGKTTIPQTVKSNGRILKLEASQVFELQEYINHTRPQIVNRTKTRSPEKLTQLILSNEGSTMLQNTCHKLMREIKHPDIKRAIQIRMSVIKEWLRTNDVRIVQYMAGHKYVSSTERYQATNLEDLQEQLRKYHPMK